MNYSTYYNAAYQAALELVETVGMILLIEGVALTMLCLAMAVVNTEHFLKNRAETDPFDNDSIYLRAKQREKREPALPGNSSLHN